MTILNPFPLLTSETALGPLIDDLESELGSDTVYQLRVTGTYYRFMGYACEARLAGLPLKGPDPLLLTPADFDKLTLLIVTHDRKRYGMMMSTIHPRSPQQLTG